MRLRGGGSSLFWGAAMLAGCGGRVLPSLGGASAGASGAAGGLGRGGDGGGDPCVNVACDITERCVAGACVNRVTEVQLPPDPGHFPVAWDLVVTAAGDIRFTEASGAIGRVAPTGEVTEIPVPLFSSTRAMIEWQIAIGRDGDLWFTETNNGESGLIGHMTASGTIQQFTLPTGQFAYAIALGPDGNLRIAETTGQIGSMTPAGALSEVSLPAGESPRGITIGADGDIWFSVYQKPEGRLGHLDSAGALAEIPLSASVPNDVAAAADGSLWVAEGSGGASDGKIAHATPDGMVTEFTVPSGTDGPADLTVGTDGNVWFTEFANDRIGRLTPDGTLTEYPLASQSFPRRITTAPDAGIWFTEAETIGYLVPP